MQSITYTVQPSKASLLLIFLFAVGALAIMVTGLYFLITNAVVQQSFVEQQGKVKILTEGMDMAHRSEFDYLLKDYISHGLSQTVILGFDAGHYQTALQSAELWAYPDSSVVTNAGSVTVSSWPATFPFSKTSNTSIGYDNFLEHPLSFAQGFVPVGALSASYTPTWNNQAFTYGRTLYLYKEIPTCFLPFSAAYRIVNGYNSNTTFTSSYNKFLDTINVSSLCGGPAVQFDSATSSNPSAQVSSDFYLMGASPPTFNNLLSTYGMSALGPESISAYASTGTTLQNRQMYSLDPNAIVLSFDGTYVNVLSAPVGGTTVPAAINTGTFDGKTRVIIDLTTLSISSNYQYKKWYIHCTTPTAMAAGIVIMDSSGSGALAPISIATDGMLYLWTKNSASSLAPVQAATSYGVVGLADLGYNGSSATSALNWAYPFALSAYTKGTTWVSDTFNRIGTLGGSSGTGFTSSDSTVTGWGNGSLSPSLNSSTVGGAHLSSSGAGGWCELSLGEGVIGTYPGYSCGGGVIGAYVTTTSFNSGNLDVIFTNTSSYVDSTSTGSERLDLNINTSTGTVNYNTYLSSGITLTAYDTTTQTQTIVGSSINTFGFFYVPATNEVFITINGALALKKKLTVIPSWFPGYLVLKMDSTVTVASNGTWPAFVLAGSPLGTLLTTPQSTYSSGTGSATFYGGVATGEGIAASLSNMSGAVAPSCSLNFSYKSAVGQALENYSERVIVHYPYFR
jgi:hypothetical protein